MSVLSRVPQALAAVVAVLLTPAQEPAAAEPAPPLPIGLQYVPADAAAFGHVDFQTLWKSPLGGTFRKLRVLELNAALAKATGWAGLNPDNVATATIYVPVLKSPLDLVGLVVVFTTVKPYDRKFILAELENTPTAKNGKYENKGNVVRITPNPRLFQDTIYSDLSDDNRLVFAVNMPTEPKADPNRAAGPHTPLFKQAAGTTILGGVCFANLFAELRDVKNYTPEKLPFLPVAKAETISLIGKLTGNELRLSVAVRSPTARLAGDVEKSLDLLRGLAKTGLTDVEKELKQAEADGDDMKTFRPLLTVAGQVLKSGKLATDDRVTTATLTVPADLPSSPLVKLMTGGAMTRNAQDTNNLKQLGISLHAYHDTFGTMCPSYLVDKKGKPTLSWRVTMLPYVEQDALYKQFKLDEPWDSAHNMKVFHANPMPPVLLCTGDKAEDKKTRYRVFTGNGSGWDATGRLKFADFTDGLSNTVAIITAETAVPWTKPDELEFDPTKPVAKLLHFRNDRSNVCLFDGSVRAITKKVSEKTLKAVITRAGGEVLGNDW